MNVDVAIVNGVAVASDGVAPLHIGVREGRIVALVRDADQLHGAELIEARGLAIFPGVIDPHCHFWEPGWEKREDWQTGTRSAAAGGVTTVIEMPLSNPPTVEEGAFRLKQQRAEGAAIVDYALWGGIVPDSAEDLEERVIALKDLGAVGFKAFMCWSAVEFPPIDDGILLSAMRVLARHDLLLGLHCENDAIISHSETALRNAGRKDPKAFLESRPEIAEYEAIQRAIALAECTGARLYIVHMSLPQGGELIRLAKRRGVRVWAETAPRYLVLDESDLAKRGPIAKCSPPLRSKSSQEHLWCEVLEGTIDTLGSDHSTFLVAEKAAGNDDIWKAPNGIADIQTAFPLMLSEGVQRRRMSLTRLAELSSTNVARIFGLYPQKGAIGVGSDADLTFVDLAAQWTIREEDMFYKQPGTPHDGTSVQGQVVRTMVRGETVFCEGDVRGRPGFGRQVFPSNGRSSASSERQFD